MALGFSAQSIPWSSQSEDLYSVCKPCDVFQPLDPKHTFGDFGHCKKCGQKMDLWTGAALRRALAEGK